MVVPRVLNLGLWLVVLLLLLLLDVLPVELFSGQFLLLQLLDDLSGPDLQVLLEEGPQMSGVFTGTGNLEDNHRHLLVPLDWVMHMLSRLPRESDVVILPVDILGVLLGNFLDLVALALGDLHRGVSVSVLRVRVPDGGRVILG